MPWRLKGRTVSAIEVSARLTDASSFRQSDKSLSMKILRTIGCSFDEWLITLLSRRLRFLLKFLMSQPKNWLIYLFAKIVIGSVSSFFVFLQIMTLSGTTSIRFKSYACYYSTILKAKKSFAFECITLFMNHNSPTIMRNKLMNSSSSLRNSSLGKLSL